MFCWSASWQSVMMSTLQWSFSTMFHSPASSFPQFIADRFRQPPSFPTGDGCVVEGPAEFTPPALHLVPRGNDTVWPRRPWNTALKYKGQQALLLAPPATGACRSRPGPSSTPLPTVYVVVVDVVSESVKFVAVFTGRVVEDVFELLVPVLSSSRTSSPVRFILVLVWQLIAFIHSTYWTYHFLNTMKNISQQKTNVWKLSEICHFVHNKFVRQIKAGLH